MSTHQDVFRLIDAGRHGRGPTVIGMKLLHHPTMRLGDLFPLRGFRNAQHLASLALGHARMLLAPRLAAPPARVSPRVSCLTPSGEPAVQISFEDPSAIGIDGLTPAMERDALRR